VHSEEPDWLERGVRFQMARVNAPGKCAEPRHARGSRWSTSVLAWGHSVAEFTQLCSRNRPKVVVLFNHLDDPSHVAFSGRIQAWNMRLLCAGHLPTAAP
jgi:hypothetical protein